MARARDRAGVGTILLEGVRSATPGFGEYISGDDFEQLVAAEFPEFFNSNHSESDFEGRSDKQSPMRGTPMLAVANEVSGTTTLFSVTESFGWDR